MPPGRTCTTASPAATSERATAPEPGPARRLAGAPGGARGTGQPRQARYPSGAALKQEQFGEHPGTEQTSVGRPWILVAGTYSGSPSWSATAAPRGVGDRPLPGGPSTYPSCLIRVSAVGIFATGSASTTYARRPRQLTGPLASGGRDGPETRLGRQDLLQQDCPADHGVAALADAGRGAPARAHRRRHRRDRVHGPLRRVGCNHQAAVEDTEIGQRDEA